MSIKPKFNPIPLLYSVTGHEISVDSQTDDMDNECIEVTLIRNAVKEGHQHQESVETIYLEQQIRANKICWVSDTDLDGNFQIVEAKKAAAIKKAKEHLLEQVKDTNQ